MILKYSLDEGGYAPERAHKEDAGFDLRTPIDFSVWGRGAYTIDTRVHVEIPIGYVGLIKSKSGLMVNYRITTDGTIDAGYTGSIAVKLFNNSAHAKEFVKGDKIAQLVIIPLAEIDGIEEVEEIHGGARGSNGFGSTGR